MPVNLDTVIKSVSLKRQEKIAARSIELLAEEMTLQQLRTACNLTQVRVAKALGINQDSVSRLENRSDLLMSTLRKAVKALGGDLVVVARFSGRPSVVLSGLGQIDQPKAKARRHRTKTPASPAPRQRARG